MQNFLKEKNYMTKNDESASIYQYLSMENSSNIRKAESAGNKS